MNRCGAVLIAVAAALVAAVPALAKEGVKATLMTNVPLDAPAGQPLHIAWTLAYPGENGRSRRFGAGGVFVRLVSASGAGAQTGFASEDKGDYTATVRVPEGGIGDVQIGLRGFTSGANGTHRADALFPITNDPVPGSIRRADGSQNWIIVLLAGALCLLAAAVLWRMRNSLRFHRRVSVRS